MRFAVVAAAALVLASPAMAKTKTAHLGAVRATVTWQPALAFTAKHVRLRIVRAGHVLVSAKLGPSLPWALRIRDLDGDGEPEVIADFYTGGAHCCLFSRIYRYTGSGYSQLRHMWGDPSYSIRDLDRDGVSELVTGDDSFAYTFTAYAGSAFPVQVWRYRAGRMTTVTRSFPALVRKDAARRWKGYLQERAAEDPDVRGILAAWMADRYLLGTQNAAWETMAELNAKGELRGDRMWAQSDAYLAKLRTFLVEHGYGGKS